MPNWSPDLYLKYRSERTQPAIDLVKRISLESPGRIIDLGCGTGNSTAVLKERWPEARITGLDGSEAMLEQARSDLPEIEWIKEDIEGWRPHERFDLIYSNAAFQWLRNMDVIVPALLEFLTENGVLAFQVPNNENSPYHRKILEVAARPKWTNLTRSVTNPLTYKKIAFFYELLWGKTRRLDIWETNYVQIMESHAAILKWVEGTGLRPYLDALSSESERAEFKADLLSEYEASYARSGDQKVLFPFNRQFVVAYVG